MPRIQWNDTYSVNNQEIDEQHQQWISLFNKLESALNCGSADELEVTRRETLKEMMDYSLYHFRFEEDYLRSIGYPRVVEHRRLHKDFGDLIYRYNQGNHDGRELVLNTRILKDIKEWLLNHILIEDKKYSDFAKGAE